MEEKEIKEQTQSFQDYVNENYEEHMHNMYPMIKMFESADTPDPKQFGFEMGFIMALNWVGKMLGLELAEPSEEEKEKIDELFVGL